MQSTLQCASCGAPLQPGAQFCAYCGAPVRTTAAPLASAAPIGAPPPPFAPPAYAPSPPPARRRPASRALIIIAVFFVVIILVGVVALAFFVPKAPSYPIAVGWLVVYSPDNACGLGLSENQIYYPGFNSSLGQSVSYPLYLPNFNSTQCTVARLVTNTTGFSISDVTLNNVALPGTIAGSSDISDPVTGTLNFTFLTPSSSFSGNVSLVFY